MLIAAGTVFLSKKTKRIMLNWRNEKNGKEPTFGFWGGKVENNETIMEGMFREISEECGLIPQYENWYLLNIYKSPDKKFEYYSYVITVEDEFIPKLNHESNGYLWCNIGYYPKNLHFGAAKVLRNSFISKNLKKIANETIIL